LHLTALVHTRHSTSLTERPSSAPPHLHSFPTRRSSDLADQGKQRGHVGPRRAPGKREAQRQEQRLALASGGVLERSGRGVPGILDRKSTRLNSSHVKISYAVFCLKKKRFAAQRSCALCT